MPYARRATCLWFCALVGMSIAWAPAFAHDATVPACKPAAVQDHFCATRSGRPAPTRRSRAKAQKDMAFTPQAASPAPEERRSRAGIEDVNTWLIFGFTEGSDVGEKGEWTLFYDSVVRAPTRGNGFAAWDGGVGIGSSPTNRAVVSLTLLPSFEQTADLVTTPNGASRVSSHGLGASASFKYQVFRREEAPVGLAVQIAPYWQHLKSSPFEHDTLGSEVRLLADRVLVPDRWFAAVNVAYQPHRDAYPDGRAFRTTTAEISGSISSKVLDNLFVGAEIRHIGKYQGFVCDKWEGDAFYVGPSAFVLLGKQGYFGVAWSARVAERVNGGAAQLPDFDGFDRHQLRFKAGVSF